LQNGSAYYYLVNALNILGEQSAYSAEVVARPASTVVQPVNVGFSNNGLQPSWSADHIGWRLLMNASSLTDANAWVFISGSNSTNLLWLPFDGTQSNLFFRLVYP
jgi:hypothetical protein